MQVQTNMFGTKGLLVQTGMAAGGRKMTQTQCFVTDKTGWVLMSNEEFDVTILAKTLRKNLKSGFIYNVTLK